MNTATEMNTWTPVCHIADILPQTGVAALVGEQQVAIFRLDDGEGSESLRAIGNIDPVMQAGVLSRGLIGQKVVDGETKNYVASPLLKHPFCLDTGVCLENAEIAVPAFAVRVTESVVEVCERASGSAV